jgi:hypothetical protein
MERVLAREGMLEKLMFPNLTGEFDEESPYERHFSGRRDNEDLQHSCVAKVDVGDASAALGANGR